jgi:DNA-binding NarL/FixJ family response regulator
MQDETGFETHGCHAGRTSPMKKLIVVADNSLIVEAIRSGMRDSGGFQLVGYADPRKARARMIAETGVDLVLVDEGDHSPEAIELIRGIKEESEEVTIIVLTVGMDGDWLRRALAAGASGGISKSVHPAALVTLVREALSGHIVHPLTSPPAASATQKEVVAERTALTHRELEILQLVAGGATNGDIARRLWITEQTVKFHVSNIYRKLDVANRTEACHYAHVNGMVIPDELPELTPVPAKGASPPRAKQAQTAWETSAPEPHVDLQAGLDPGLA